MKRLGLSLAALLISAHLASASAMSERFAPIDDTTINPNVFTWLFKLYLVSDSLPTDLRIGNTSLLAALNFHIQDNGGQVLSQAEIDDLVAMKTYYLSLGPAGKTLYLEFLEGVTWALQQGLLDVMVDDPQGYWDEVFLGIPQQQAQGLAVMTRQAETGGSNGTYKEVDQQFATEIQAIVGGAGGGDIEAVRALAQSGIDQIAKMRPGVQQAKVNALKALEQNVQQQKQINTLLKKK